jgi:hypothetical protein
VENARLAQNVAMPDRFAIWRRDLYDDRSDGIAPVQVGGEGEARRAAGELPHTLDGIAQVTPVRSRSQPKLEVIDI